MDGGDILSHFPRTVAWTSRTPLDLVFAAATVTRVHALCTVIHGALRLSRTEAVI